jgi:hypothetical protein
MFTLTFTLLGPIVSFVTCFFCGYFVYIFLKYTLIYINYLTIVFETHSSKITRLLALSLILLSVAVLYLVIQYAITKMSIILLDIAIKVILFLLKFILITAFTESESNVDED